MPTNHLNLPFSIADTEETYLETLPIEIQERLWRIFYTQFESEIRDGTSYRIEQLKDPIDEMKLVIQEGDREQLLDWAQGERTDEYVETKNPYTDEIIRKKKRSSDDLSNDQLRENIQEQLDEINRILSSPLQARIKYFWAQEIDNFDEASLFEAASELPGLEQIIKDFELLQTGFEITRVGETRKPDLHPDYVNQLLEWRSLGNKTTEPSVAAQAVLASGKRLTKEAGPCYICGQLVTPFEGELILWSEIPKDVREQYIPGIFRKWHIRHFTPECSKPEFGTRELFLHPKGPFERRNAKADKCIVCDCDVPAESGWLITASVVPKWKQTRAAFPGAITKNYYVTCGKEE